MRSAIVLVAAFVVSAAFIGIGPAWAQEKAPEPAAKVEKKISEAAEAVKQYTQQQKKAYETKAKSELEDLKQYYRELKKKAAEAKGQAAADLNEAAEAAKKKLDSASAKLNNLGTATAERWPQVRKELDQAFSELRDAYEKAVGSSH